MFDIGVNLTHPQFDADRAAVIVRARAAGITGMLVTSTDLETTRRAITLCNSSGDPSGSPPFLHCTAGVHPHDAKDAPLDLAAQLKDLAESPAVKAIGETGLDFNRNFSPPHDQRRVFDDQLEVAAELGLPAFIHDRESGGALLEHLAPAMSALSGAVVHCFTGTAAELDAYLDLGCHIGITGWVCDRRRGDALRELVPSIPLERLLIETDAPFLLPHSAPAGWHADNDAGSNRRRNEPALLPLVIRELARLTGTGEQELAAVTERNARRLFGIGEPA